MDTIMTIDDLYKMLIEERRVCSDTWYDYENKADDALMVGDHGTEAEYRVRAHRAKQRCKEIDKILREIYKLSGEWRKNQGSA